MAGGAFSCPLGLWRCEIDGGGGVLRESSFAENTLTACPVIISIIDRSKESMGSLLVASVLSEIACNSFDAGVATGLEALAVSMLSRARAACDRLTEVLADALIERVACSKSGRLSPRHWRKVSCDASRIMDVWLA